MLLEILESAYNGFSIGIDDNIANLATMNHISQTIAECKASVTKIIEDATI
jgi:hypothetical protein